MTDGNLKAIFDAMMNIVTKSGKRLSLADQLSAIESAWGVVALRARNAQLSPDGFLAERDRQVAQLEMLAALVRDDTPNFELGKLERLRQEDDCDAVTKHVERMMDEAKKGGK
jgi:hypothetical protein